MGKEHFIAWILVLSLIYLNDIEAQSVKQDEDIHIVFDNIVGEEISGLYNGIQYANEFIVLDDKHQFLDTSNFVKGFVSYDGQEHYGVFAKYDLYLDELIIRPLNASDGLAFLLIKSLVDGFSLNGKSFVNVRAFNQKTGEPFGYCQLLSESKFFSLYKKSNKKPSKKAKTGKIFYEFNQSSVFYLEYDGEYYPATTRNELISIFPEYKDIIKDYYKGFKQLQKSEPDNFMKLLMARLKELLQSKTT